MLGHVRVCIGLGEGWPADGVLCRVMGWRYLTSVRAALRKLEARGDIARVGTEGRGWSRRILWVLTPQGINRRLECRRS
jgi:hypothetical protein